MKAIKRLFIVLSILLGILSFKMLYQSFATYQESRFWNADVLEKGNNKLLLKLEHSDDKNYKTFYTQLTALAKSKDIIIYRGTNQTIKGNNVYDWYFYGENMDFYVTENPILYHRILNFSSNKETGYYVNDKNDKKAEGYIFQEGEGLGLIKVHSFYPLIHNNIDISGVYYFVGNKNACLEVINKIKELYPTFHYEDINPNSINEQTIYNSENQTVLYSFIYITIALLILVIFSMILKSLRLVSIMKMHGYGVLKIIFQNYMKILTLSFLIIIAVHSGLFIYKFESINKISLQFIPLLCKVYVYYILSILIVIILSGIYINKRIKVVSLVKNESNMKQVRQTVYVMKFLTLIFLLPSFALNFYKSKENIMNYTSYYLNREKIENLYYFTGFDPNTSMSLSLEDQKDFMKMMDKHGGIYYDETDLLVEDEFKNIPTIKVNENYLKINKVYDLNNKPIRSTRNHIKVLVPERYYEDPYFDENAMYCRGKCEYVKIKDNTKIFRYQLGLNEEGILNNSYLNGYILYVIPNENVLVRKEMTDRYFIQVQYKNKLQTFLKNHQYGETIHYEQLHKHMDGEILRYTKNEILKNSITYINYLIIILLISYQYILLYIDSEKRKICIKKIHGYHFMIIHNEFMQASVYLYAGAMALLMIFQTGLDWKLIEAVSILAFVDIGLSMISLIIFNRKNLITTIKGDE